MENLKIAICGVGIVGNAMLESFLKKGFKIDKDILIYDKFRNGGMGSFESLLNSDILFLALPTPFDENLKSYNIDAIIETLRKLRANNYKGPIVIKSTMEPQNTNNMAKEYLLNLIHNPEFLTAKTAPDDFHYQAHIVLGKSVSCEEDKFYLVRDFYKFYYPDAEISLCTSDESESMKIFCNCFYSTKIQFFTEMYLLCQKIDVSYNNAKNLMLKNGWINEMHTEIPGPDGHISYGGLCFPKDTNALNRFMISNDTPNRILDATITERDEMREDNNNIIKKD